MKPWTALAVDFSILVDRLSFQPPGPLDLPSGCMQCDARHRSWQLFTRHPDGAAAWIDDALVLPRGCPAPSQRYSAHLCGSPLPVAPSIGAVSRAGSTDVAGESPKSPKYRYIVDLWLETRSRRDGRALLGPARLGLARHCYGIPIERKNRRRTLQRKRKL